jgi:hypothetical protein
MTDSRSPARSPSARFESVLMSSARARLAAAAALAGLLWLAVAWALAGSGGA